MARTRVDGPPAPRRGAIGRARTAARPRIIARSLDKLPLFATDADLGAAIMPPGKANEWPVLAKGLEKIGLPLPDPIIGGRYVPAVKAFFDKRAGVRKDGVPGAVDGEEDWTHERNRRSRRART